MTYSKMSPSVKKSTIRYQESIADKPVYSILAKIIIKIRKDFTAEELTPKSDWFDKRKDDPHHHHHPRTESS
jgi:hypothetical protein